MIKRITVLIVLASFAINNIKAQSTHIMLSKTDNIKFDFEILKTKKAKIKAKDKSLITAYNQLLKDADKLLNYQPVSVMDKTDFPPSGNKHDYMSIGPYWWPDPAKPNGLPYIKKDGEVNPEVKNFPDKENMPKLCENINTLSLAYYYSNNEKYAKHATKLLEVWFLDTATKMNPNLKYGQAVKGKNEGRAEGVIDTRQFIFAIDGMELLKGSKSWTIKHQIQMKQWFGDFLHWLNTSKIGIDEMNAKNNHSVWFDAQALSIALFVDSLELANKIVLRAADRLDKQMDDKGLFPYEMERTTSLHYSAFIMNAFTIIAQLSEKTTTNLWTLETKSGKSFKKGFDALYPYLTKEKEWTGKQIKEFNYADGYAILLVGASKLNYKNSIQFIQKNEGEKFKTSMVGLL
jgi:hypothetical protein